MVPMSLSLAVGVGEVMRRPVETSIGLLEGQRRPVDRSFQQRGLKPFLGRPEHADNQKVPRALLHVADQ